MYRAGELDDKEIVAVESRLATTAGTCPVMGTASTMACIAETMGMALPGTAAIPAVHADRLRAAEETGKQAVRIAAAGLSPDKIVSEKSVENALRVLLAIGGSTNGIIHLTAIAGRAGVRISLNRLNEISDETPVLVNLNLLVTITWKIFSRVVAWRCSARDQASSASRYHDSHRGNATRTTQRDPSYINPDIVRPFAEPHYQLGGLVALFGSLAPNGAILKRASADDTLFESEGRAVVFTSPADLAKRIDDPDLDVTGGLYRSPKRWAEERIWHARMRIPADTR